MGTFPTKRNDIVTLLKNLGFVLDLGTGRGGHYKFVHPSRVPIVANQRPFIILPKHTIENSSLNKVIKSELRYFGFTNEEIKKACPR